MPFSRDVKFSDFGGNNFRGLVLLSQMSDAAHAELKLRPGNRINCSTRNEDKLREGGQVGDKVTMGRGLLGLAEDSASYKIVEIHGKYSTYQTNENYAKIRLSHKESLFG